MATPTYRFAPTSALSRRPARRAQPSRAAAAPAPTPAPAPRPHAAPLGLRVRPLAPATAPGLWVRRPLLTVGFNMPVPNPRNFQPWGYTLPTHVRGAFIRTLGGVLMRHGRARPCLRALHSFCSAAPAPSRAPFVPAPVGPQVVVHVGGTKARARPLCRRLIPARPWALRCLGAPLAAQPSLAPQGRRLARPSRVPPQPRSQLGAGGELAPRFGPQLPQAAHLATWDMLRDQPRLAYGLKYCRLSRRVRKILRNKYRYSKYFFMVPPAKRLLVTLHL
jgi:hypothetical protein